MPLMIRQMLPGDALAAHISLESFGQVLTPDVLAAALNETGSSDRRVRKLPMQVTLMVCIAMNLYAADALPAVFRRLVSGLRWVWPHPGALSVTAGAICQARERLGARPLVALFRQVCRPLATPATPGAFFAGLRVMALDGTKLNLADTPANARAFGRPTSARGHSAWPQLQLIALCECGAHVICDAGVWRYDVSERAGAQRLLRSVQPDMLVMWDQGLHSAALVAAVCERGAQVLARMPTWIKPTLVTTLDDGTQLVRLHGGARTRHHLDVPPLVRLIRYTLDDPRRPGHGVEHRLITSLLDLAAAPAEDLIVAYHSRWEFELTIDELVTHQRPDHPLRSKKPVGVIQECYALLLAHYLVRRIMFEAAGTADLPPTQLSFLTTLRLVCEALPDFQRTAPADHPIIVRSLLTQIVAAKLPPRANRINPRVVKQKMSNFPVKRPEHRHPPPVRPFREVIVILI